MNQTYSGWSNYETWCVNLWVTNEPDTEEQLRMLAQVDASTPHRADCLKRYVSDMAPIEGATMFVDLLRAALDNVAWWEIIENHEHDDDDDD